MPETNDPPPPRGRRIARRAPRAPRDPSARALLRLLLLGPPEAPGDDLTPAALRAPPADAAAVPPEVRAALAEDEPPGEVLDGLLDACALAGLAPAERCRALQARARWRAEDRGRRGRAARDWLGVSAIDPEAVPASVLRWLLPERIGAGDASALAVALYLEHVEELDRSINERPALERERLGRALERLGTRDQGADDADWVTLLRRLLRLNNRRPGLELALGLRLFLAGSPGEAAEAFDRAEDIARRASFHDRRRSLHLLWLGRGAVALTEGDAARGKRALARAAAVAPERPAPSLLYALVELRLGQPARALDRARARRRLERTLAAEGARPLAAPLRREGEALLRRLAGAAS